MKFVRSTVVLVRLAELTYPLVPRPTTVLVKLGELINPAVPKDVMLLWRDAVLT